MVSLVSARNTKRPGNPPSKHGDAKLMPPVRARRFHLHPSSAPARSTPVGTRGFHPHPSAVRTRIRPSQAQFDELLVWILIGLLTLGLVMVYSSDRKSVV